MAGLAMVTCLFTSTIGSMFIQKGKASWREEAGIEPFLDRVTWMTFLQFALYLSVLTPIE